MTSNKDNLLAKLMQITKALLAFSLGRENISPREQVLFELFKTLAMLGAEDYVANYKGRMVFSHEFLKNVLKLNVPVSAKWFDLQVLDKDDKYKIVFLPIKEAENCLYC
ncbi:MAG: hypothetical protein ABIM32_03655 [candidate division WOR-3 bacterium]